ncbi:hypothetical protein ACTWP5_16695 [Streptomyces sp. 4N509B]|uniref:hypothetical protein n=1 Tax=Streptomyces sp. 4N509B TaxID=3457413 RepID=UPI003FD64E51
MMEDIPLADELDKYTVTPGVLGFVVFAVLGVGVWILLKSMSKHLGKIDFEVEGGKDGPTSGTSPTPTPSASASTSSATSSSA